MLVERDSTTPPEVAVRLSCPAKRLGVDLAVWGERESRHAYTREGLAERAGEPPESRPVGRSHPVCLHVRRVARKDLVRALPDMHDRDPMVLRELRHEVERHAHRIGDGLVLV